jgi:hypothetical protein
LIVVLVRYLGSQDDCFGAYPAIRYIFLVLKQVRQEKDATIRASDSFDGVIGSDVL